MIARGPSWVPLLIGVLVALIGLFWIGQGVGLIPGSVMTGSMVWTILGVVAVVAGGLIAGWGLRRRGT